MTPPNSARAVGRSVRVAARFRQLSLAAAVAPSALVSLVLAVLAWSGLRVFRGTHTALSRLCGADLGMPLPGASRTGNYNRNRPETEANGNS